MSALLATSAASTALAQGSTAAPAASSPNAADPAGSSAPPGGASQQSSPGAGATPLEPAVAPPPPATTATTTAARTPPAVATPVVTPPPPPPTPLAAWHNDLFYISSPDHSWFIAPTGRVHLDGYLYVGDRINDDMISPAGAFRRGDVKDGLLLRRARIEILGGFLRRYTFMLGGELTSAAAPIATDIIFNAQAFPELNLQVGQFDAPFTLENRTSDKYIDFMERSLAVRAFGIPTNKEIGLMVWGETPSRLFYYSVGLFDGDGQNRVNRDNNLEVMGRAFIHPFILAGGPLANVQIGGSFRYGRRGRSIDYAYPSMTSQAGFAFFGPQIGGATPSVIVPDNDQLAIAAEIDIPIDRFDVRAEFIYVSNQTREMPTPTTGAPLALGGDSRLSGNALRLGDLSGISGYVQLGWWVFGARDVNGRPGYQNPPALNLQRADPGTPPMGLQVVARFDAVDFRYQGGSRGAISTASSPADGRYAVYAAEFGATFWATRHVRFSVNYLQYFFPGQAATPNAATLEDNHATGPRNDASSFGELTARVGLVL